MKNIQLFEHWLLERVSAESYDAIKLYQNGNTVTDVQRYLRGLPMLKIGNYSVTTEYLQQQIEAIDAAMKPVKPGTVLWRGVDDPKYTKSSFTDLGYVSTAKSLNNTVKVFSGVGGVIMKIIVGKGVKGININAYLSKKDIDGVEQEEFLLQRGLRFTLQEENEHKTYIVE